ncbi:hypothetical protein [Acinetobacter soli]|uniref:hypothetical protein n=1 Tax=Acinetobacter soli TaxID=487316 RepID=UPI0012509A06|nr:hypothetical protein [Acinetobacter soli]
MIDLELERKAFEELSYKNGVRNFTKDDVDGGYCSAELDYNWHIWIKSAESNQAEIDSLKAQLAKVESGEYVVVPVRELKVILSCVSPDDMNLYEGVYEASEVIEKAMIEAAQENSHE